MKKVTLLAAAAAVSALIATPVVAQDNVRSKSGAYTGAKQHQARMQPRAMRNRAMARNRMADRRRWARNNWERRDTSFGPGEVAGGIVGGAIGTAGAITAGALNTAGAIATAPFGGPTYNRAYYDGGPYYSEVGGGYPFGNAWRYGHRRSYASMDNTGWDDSYAAAYDNPGYGGYGYAAYDYNGIAIPASPNFDARNGFTCRPGTLTKLGNQRVICQ